MSLAATREIYGRLELLSEVTGANGAHGKDLVVLRPTARDMSSIFDGNGPRELLTQFVNNCCRITNGTGDGQMHAFAFDQLHTADAAELLSIITAIGDEGDKYSVQINGDGVNEPIVYNLQRPITLSRPGAAAETESEVIRQISFQAKKVGQISEFLDARGAKARFDSFMRGFGELLGTNLPMSDSIIGTIDVLDYLVIVQHIMSKLTGPRARWKKES